MASLFRKPVHKRFLFIGVLVRSLELGAVAHTAASEATCKLGTQACLENERAKSPGLLQARQTSERANVEEDASMDPDSGDARSPLGEAIERTVICSNSNVTFDACLQASGAPPEFPEYGTVKDNTGKVYTFQAFIMAVSKDLEPPPQAMFPIVFHLHWRKRDAVVSVTNLNSVTTSSALLQGPSNVMKAQQFLWAAESLAKYHGDTDHCARDIFRRASWKRSWWGRWIRSCPRNYDLTYYPWLGYKCKQACGKAVGIPQFPAKCLGAAGPWCARNNGICESVIAHVAINVAELLVNVASLGSVATSVKAAATAVKTWQAATAAAKAAAKEAAKKAAKAAVKEVAKQLLSTSVENFLKSLMLEVTGERIDKMEVEEILQHGAESLAKAALIDKYPDTEALLLGIANLVDPTGIAGVYTALQADSCAEHYIGPMPPVERFKQLPTGHNCGVNFAHIQTKADCDKAGITFYGTDAGSATEFRNGLHGFNKGCYWLQGELRWTRPSVDRPNIGRDDAVPLCLRTAPTPRPTPIPAPTPAPGDCPLGQYTAWDSGSSSNRCKWCTGSVRRRRSSYDCTACPTGKSPKRGQDDCETEVVPLPTSCTWTSDCVVPGVYGAFDVRCASGKCYLAKDCGKYSCR